MNKQEKKAALQRLIDSQSRDVLFTEDAVEEMNELTGWSFKAYRKIKNPKYPGDPRCVQVSSDGASFEVQSWSKSVSGANHDKAALNAALRRAVASRLPVINCSCEACGAEDDLTIDHKSTPFIDIAKSFEELHPDGIALINSSDGGGWRIESDDVYLAWIAFHADSADYQVLCRSCNASKGAR